MVRQSQISSRGGLSPRMRGNRHTGRDHIRGASCGSIPAHAGEPPVGDCAVGPCTGLSPRMRGNPDHQDLGDYLVTPVRVYPRACGGTSTRIHRAALVDQGSIPAHAGEPHLLSSELRLCLGSIPAHAGEPSRAFWPDDVVLPGLSPRMRGNRHPVRPFAWTSSLSPRMRGNRGGSARVRPSSGLSPRMRGNPDGTKSLQHHCSGLSPCTGVYPRACGGTGPVRTVDHSRTQGLSPRMRGNRDLQAGSAFARRLGSIPAHAGEPPAIVSCPSFPGSIPAHAGEPFALRSPTSSVTGLSPRMRGNRRHSTPTTWSLGGLSPRMRGNLRQLGNRRPVIGRVYPRACGGTDALVRLRPDAGGLSPRMRGNPHSSAGDGGMGSIPAHAGEP